jgi:hypothetical protein
MEDYNTGACYTYHISTNSNLPCVIAWPGGSKMRVFRGGEAPAQKGGGKRGKVSLFSAGSRKRLLRKLAEISREAKPLFVTLTFPDEYISQVSAPVHWKICLKRFLQSIRRDYPGIGLVWRLEIQTRKSGKYLGCAFPHYHLLVYGAVDVDHFRKYVSRVWWRSCGKLSDAHLRAGTNVTPTTGGKRLLIYLSKYMAKVDVSRAPALIGRVWGVSGLENIPFVRSVLTVLSQKEAFTLLRYMRRYANIRGKDYFSLTVFLDAGWWWDNLPRILHPD